jgi:hypothetical protein
MEKRINFRWRVWISEFKRFSIRIMNQKLFTILVAILILSSCKTIHFVPKSTIPSGNPVAQLIEQVQTAQPKFQTANVSKMSMEIILNDKKVSVAATCRIKKDSVLFFSILPFMGIELYKAELKPDSIRVFDKTNRTYYTTDYGYFAKNFGVQIDFYSLQALIFNQFFCVGEKELLTDSCKVTLLNENRKKIDFQNSYTQQSTEISATNNIQQVALKDKNNSFQLQTNYTDFSVVNGVNFPQSIAIQATTPKRKVSCNLTILKVEFNSDLKFQATNTERYSLIAVDHLIKK